MSLVTRSARAARTWWYRGSAPKGGEQGSSGVGGWMSASPYLHTKGSGEFVLGKVHFKDKVKSLSLDSFIAHKSEQHLWVMGPTRARKGTGVLMYNILSHPGNQIIFDPKGEAYLVAAEALKAKGKKVVLLDPFHFAAERLGQTHTGDECGFNAIASLSPYDNHTPRRIAEIAKILTDRVDSGGNSGGDKNQLWYDLARNVVAGLLAFSLIYKSKVAQKIIDAKRKSGEPYTYGDMRQIYIKQNILIAANFTKMEPKERLHLLFSMRGLRARMIKDAQDRGEPPPRIPTVMRLIETGASDAITLVGPKADPEGMRSLLNVMSTAFLWVDTPTMERHLCGLDFSFDMAMLKRVDNLVVFVVVPDTALESHGAYLRMVLTCAANAVTGNQWDENIGARKHKINFILDEFALYGRMPALERLFALGSGYGARCIIVSQNKTHVDKVYSAEGSAIFLANAAVVFLGGGDNETAAYFAEKCGETLSRDKETGEEGDDQVQVFTPQEILNLTHPDRDTGIYFESGCRPLRFRICVYYELLEAGVDFRQNIDHVRLRDKIQRPGQSPRLVSVARGYGDPTSKEGDEEPEHIMISDGEDNLPAIHH